MKRAVFLTVLAVAGAATGAEAFELRCRWVVRTSIPEDLPIDPYPFLPGQTIILRLQFGLFTDADGEPPAGGFIGWNVGTIDGGPGPVVAASASRLQPFTFAPAPGFQGTLDPLHLNNIDNTLGTQSPVWRGVPGTDDPGQPPGALERGIDTFVSVFQIAITTGADPFEVTAAGNAIGAASWGIIQQTPPDPGPDGVFGAPGTPEEADDINGSVIYAPSTLPPIPFSNCVRHFVPVPGPPGACILGLGALVAARRRR